MSSGFIGSKIAIITKSQYRYVGTIIGIDAQASSILLGNVKCFGTENRGGNFANSPMVGTVVPIMQFANSDIEDLKIVDEEPTVENQAKAQQQPSFSMSVLSSPPAPPPPPVQKPLSIHDDPAVVSAVLSTSTKDLPMANRLLNDLHQLKLSDDQTKTEESRLRTGSGELGPSWSLLSPSKWETTKPIPQQTQPVNKSKFFDDFSLNPTDSNNRSQQQQQRWPSTNASSNQILRLQDNFHNEQKDDKTNLPVRQPFMSNDRSYSQQQNRYQNGNGHYQQKNFYNNRRAPMNNQHRRIGGSNRETFQDNANSYDDEFDFESNNRKFNKITNEDEFVEQSTVLKHEPTTPADFEPIYDKKKSFFDNITLEDTSNVSGPNYTRLRNQDTFGNDRNRRQRQGGNSAPMGGGGGGGGFRRSNHNNYRQQQRNDDFYYRQNNNGYHYRN